MSNQLTLEQAQKICRNLLDLNPPETIEKIKDAIQKVASILTLSLEDQEELFARLKQVTGVTQDEPRILDNNVVIPWIAVKWSENIENRKFWKRYRDYLADGKKIAPKVILRLDELTDKILDRLADPEAYDQFDRRGLVVGHVQSGKTSNYVGLITKAADAGYKLIIVLAGIHSSLRSQTQLRIDEGFLGYDTVTNRSFNSATNRIGVGKIDPTVQAHSLTSSALNGDFKKNARDIINLTLRGADPVVVVIKKNNSVLKNLIHWLSGNAGEPLGENERIINNLPLLLIDDEADNASINISKNSVSSINGSIRALLQLFSKSAYVGYTATPYANVFIPPNLETEGVKKGVKIAAGNRDYPIGEDLFPRDFIVNIPPPSNYIGPEKFFGIASEDQISEEVRDTDDDNPQPGKPIHLFEPVKDYQPADYFDSEVVEEEIRQINPGFIPDKHKKDDVKPQDIPDSLKSAIRFFILACAARRVRGQVNVHNSMLIHVTRFISWQNHIALLVEEELNRYKNRIEFRNMEFICDLKAVWEKSFVPKTQEIKAIRGLDDAEMTAITWAELELQLLPAVIRIQVRAVHGSSLLGGLEPENIQPLDYYENSKGLSVIAVGGNKLSRGLTLEGLTISYYLRASKMYDTLMQMGRWFGYRPGYLDLCRLFTSNDLVSNYKFITAATEEMRAEFDRMWLLRKKPLDYGLKVRAHSGVLTITAANKFRYKQMMSFGFSAELEETWQFDKTRKDWFENNHQTTRDFIQQLGSPTGLRNSSKYLRTQPNVWYSENNYSQVTHFLNEYLSSQPSFYPRLLKEYIEKQAVTGKLTNWTIALINNSRATGKDIVTIYGNRPTGLSYRKDDAEPGSRYFEITKAHIIGNFHEYIDLDDEQLAEALEATKIDRALEGKTDETEHPSPLRIRRSRSESNGLLLIYPLNPEQSINQEPYNTEPIIGLAISFPYIKDEEKVEYAVNEVFMKELYDYADALDLEELDPEEEEEGKTSLVQKTTFSEETFRNLIENNFQVRFDETEFFSGMAPEYAKPSASVTSLKTTNNLVVSIADYNKGRFDGLPFYTEKDIQQYYMYTQPGQMVISPDTDFINNGECVIGLKRSRYVTFSYYNGKAVFADSCWIIRSGRFSTRYIAALMNSTLFGAWVRVQGELKKDTYFITNEVLKTFPVVIPETTDMEVLEKLYDLLIASGEKRQEKGGEAMKAYYSNLLDALIFCNYFPDSMKKESETLFTELRKVLPAILPEQKKRSAAAEELFGVIYDRMHPIREVLFYLGNQSKVSRIKSVFIR